GAGVEFDGLGGDGEAEAGAAGSQTACGVDAEEWFEEAWQHFGRDSGAVVANGEHGAIAFSVEAQLDRFALATVMDGVADDVFDRTLEDLGIAVDAVLRECG